MWPKFIPSQHPRGANGRFVSKGSVGVRVSTRSVSVNAGRRFPIVPGKVNLYVGVLARVENASRTKGPIGKAADRVQDRIVKAFPEGAARRIAGGLAGHGQFKEGSTLISGSTGRRSAPTLRATRSSGGHLKQGGSTYTQKTVARRPRAPRQPRVRKVAA